jgi:hypothetical protein
MENEQEYMDTSAPARYIEHLRTIPFPVEENILRLFKGDQSNEYYLGMIAGVKAYLNILNNIPMPGDFFDGCLHISIDLQKVIVQHIK